jgi:phosphoribosylanthranilate isomerase
MYGRTGFMVSGERGQSGAGLTHPLIRMKTEVKICGLTNLDDAKAAVDSGADYIGFVLYPKSPRAVNQEALPGLLNALPSARAVAVVVNMDRRSIEWLVGRCALHAVQFHGNEDPAVGQGLDVRLWRAVSYRDGAWAPDPGKWDRAARLVVDASDPKRYGGSGELADWTEATKLAVNRQVMLAGGLNLENVAAAVRAVRPIGVDVASGVEIAPGRKDHAAMRRFVEAVRREERGEAQS